MFDVEHEKEVSWGIYQMTVIHPSSAPSPMRFNPSEAALLGSPISPRAVAWMTVKYGLDLRSGLEGPHNLVGGTSPAALIRPGPPFYGPDPSSTHRYLDYSSTAIVRTLRTVYFAS